MKCVTTSISDHPTTINRKNPDPSGRNPKPQIPGPIGRRSRDTEDASALVGMVLQTSALVGPFELIALIVLLPRPGHGLGFRVPDLTRC